ncbi:hypothetical protein [Noviherbaspirillum sp.]|uniref:hypothetical protein n=1 Tax=Noviherbaspirillum sp. TaxID=1926288 RepID=UPI002B46D77D|nr:hypothetical protein [Noviherbaspirillum sp.]HJV83314.1 hypothetical protein [Noviherbaspirillum sp.]
MLRCAVTLTLLCISGTAFAQQLDTHFSCSAVRNEDGETVTYADTGEFQLNGDRIDAFSWESSLFRSTHGFDCSIDASDGLNAEVRTEQERTTWRVTLKDARAARDRRGFKFDRRMNCTIRLEREGDTLAVKPSCPALCGSRSNFTELSVDMKTGKCRYDE